MTDLFTLMSSPMPREQKLELALRMARSWMQCVEPRLLDTPNFRRDMETLDAALSAPKAEAAEPVDYQWREGRSTRHAPDEWYWGPWHAGRLPAHVENREYLRYEERALYTSPVPALTDEAVERAAEAIAGAWGEKWACCCTEQRGLDCDCGDAMNEDREGRPYDEDLTREDCRMAARAGLLAAFPSKGEGE